MAQPIIWGIQLHDVFLHPEDHHPVEEFQDPLHLGAVRYRRHQVGLELGPTNMYVQKRREEMRSSAPGCGLCSFFPFLFARKGKSKTSWNEIRTKARVVCARRGIVRRDSVCSLLLLVLFSSKDLGGGGGGRRRRRLSFFYPAFLLFFREDPVPFSFSLPLIPTPTPGKKKKGKTSSLFFPLLASRAGSRRRRRRRSASK